jgi:DNA ligase (NAD+)
VEFFAARGALDIESIGGIVADKLVERGPRARTAGSFRLKGRATRETESRHRGSPARFRRENATKAINAIERARTLPLSRWLFALAIPDVGKTTATQLARFMTRSRTFLIRNCSATSWTITKSAATKNLPKKLPND